MHFGSPEASQTAKWNIGGKWADLLEHGAIIGHLFHFNLASDPAGGSEDSINPRCIGGKSPL